MKFKNSTEAIKLAQKITTEHLNAFDEIEIDDEMFLATAYNIGLFWLMQSVKLTDDKHEMCRMITNRMLEIAMADEKPQKKEASEEDRQKMMKKMPDVYKICDDILEKINSVGDTDEQKNMILQSIHTALITIMADMVIDKEGFFDIEKEKLELVRKKYCGK